MSAVEDNIRRIREDIAEAALRSGREPSEVRLMAVTKTVDDDRILEAIEAGVDIMGENYVQEAKRKIEKMDVDVEWHMIGHLQSNKAKYAVRLFDMVHSVDRTGLATELDRRSASAERVTNILIEVNVSGEESKSGVSADGATALVREISLFNNLSIRGLMTMPPWFDNPEDARPYFVALRELRDKIVAEDIKGVEMRELSMGMSGDYQVAVEEGATIVRIGTAIFGARVY
ncbi:MAG: YggS family pyridoxal phosphate-dependent enzyme [Deltaproteobacteria bacterium]|nr:YggS family pyridoxal phosphate-dependent enzyme [Deltaproteobacteria bacterium]MBW2596583.1 YggS family pyridoxal phosphate-dependent enzyme [Deltaproteobacteria bacterium]MBW2651125.1 YggS family pyridoxal phosphate-dependent enzyme [Deltaproteobacteria bacterium]